MTVEFSRPVRIETIGEGSRSLSIEADPAERERLAARFGLERVDSLVAEFSLSRLAAGIAAEGRVRAAVVQSCVATAEPVPATIDEPVHLLFSDAPASTEEIELGEDELDVIPFDGGAVDLGEAAAETMALALDPYPRAPGADAALRAAGIRTEEEARAESSPFAALRDVLAPPKD